MEGSAIMAPKTDCSASMLWGSSLAEAMKLLSSIGISALNDFNVDSLGNAVVELDRSCVRAEILDICAESDLLLVDLYAELLLRASATLPEVTEPKSLSFEPALALMMTFLSFSFAAASLAA